jgi:hypothetical protein
MSSNFKNKILDDMTLEICVYSVMHTVFTFFAMVDIINHFIFTELNFWDTV